ncbi:glycoside hydrolase domain-containing protein [Streptomyces sp. CB02923]|uniref:glycoside hydrolase domain-containing protein n=1 Tax=Streptomyces sp. CB02923 TaxID=1718985 RepID=UPI001F5C04A2|nr:glycoside hydrolase domain-containing protein [Streptomyces sp. CB02923]
MSLQHELGISPVAANFGSGTIAKLAALGNIGFGWKENANIVKILRHGLFCKGYWGGEMSIEYYDMAAGGAVNKMKSNMGLSEDGVVQPKVFKAILNMDAYVMLASGSEEVRGIQQWLNGRYWTKSTSSIGPADGHYSRDVQQALMKALQIEVGIPESQATGNFGDGTKSALRQHTVSEGSSGIFVQLFSAACVFNQPVVMSGQTSSGEWVEQNWTTSFRSSFDSNLKSFVSTFQKFSQLQVNGMGDFATWAQLLVSPGDSDRPVIACDTRFVITKQLAKKLYGEGFRYLGRYIYQPDPDFQKEIKPGELDNIFAADLRVFPIFQDNNRRLVDFTWSKGFANGQLAHDRAVHYGFNRGTIIYFAVDYDATDADMSHVIDYFRGVAAGLGSRGKRYVHGVYGSRNVCAQVTKETYARFSFVSGMSWGFSGNLGFPMPANWSFTQIKELSKLPNPDGGTYDLDRDAYRIGTDLGQNKVNGQTSPADDFINYIQGLYDLAVKYGKGNPNQLVMEYIRHKAYGGVQWWVLIGSPDRGFINYAEENHVGIRTDFKDPFTGYNLGAEHLMATCNTHFVKAQPSESGTVNLGDVGGWGGDLFTFYGEWRRDSDTTSSGYTYCKERLGKIGIPTSFSFNDLVEDADGYLLAQRVRGGQTIAEAVRAHYAGSGGVDRFKDYYMKRFGGSVPRAAALAREMLTTEQEPIAAGRTFLIKQFAGVFSTGPGALPKQKLDEFCNGFAEVLASHVKAAVRNRPDYLANQRRNLRSAH